MSRQKRPFGRLASQRAARRRRGRHAPPGRPPSLGRLEEGEVENLDEDDHWCGAAIDEVLAEAGLGSDFEPSVSER